MSSQAPSPAHTELYDQVHHAKRLICSRCLRAQKACICPCVRSVSNLVEVLILQHPQEAKHIKSSGRLLQLCLQTSRIAIAEQFDETELENWLSAGNKQAYLLYPEEQSNDETRAKDVLPDLSAPILEKIRLVVIDASWRQSRKMLRDNPVLQTLPRYSLRDVPASRYLIRQAHQIDQLSSLEACCYTLMDLEKSDQQYQGLLDAFDAFNQMQIALGVQRLQR